MSVICSYTAMACDVLVIVAMIAFLLKYCKTMQVMHTAFLQKNTEEYWHTVGSSRPDRQDLSTIIYIKYTKRGRDYR